MNLEVKKMTAQEIQTALKKLQEAFKIGVLEYTGADPIINYNVDPNATGLHFANTKITSKDHKRRNYLYVAKVAEDLGLLYNFIDDEKQIFFDSFDSIIYTPEERLAIEEINKNMCYYKNEIKVLNSVRFKTKKDGKPFKDITKNIDDSMIDHKRLHASISGSWLNLKLATFHNDFNTYNETSIQINDMTIDSIKTAIENAKTRDEKMLKQYESEIKNIKKTFAKFYKFKDEIKNTSYCVVEVFKKFMY